MSKDAMRQAMPVTASIVDEYRQWLGKVIYAEENGKVIDRREPVNADAVFDIPADYYPCRPMLTKERK
jgi:hypothetical protein